MIRAFVPVLIWLAVCLALAFQSCQAAHAGERPQIPPLDEAAEVRPTPSGLTILVFIVEHRELEATFATSPSDPEPVCDRVVLIERDGYYLAKRGGRACMYRLVPEPVQWRWADTGRNFESWIEKTYHPLTLETR